jgi:hypothetical protein
MPDGGLDGSSPGHGHPKWHTLSPRPRRRMGQSHPVLRPGDQVRRVRLLAQGVPPAAVCAAVQLQEEQLQGILRGRGVPRKPRPVQRQRLQFAGHGGGRLSFGHTTGGREK